MPGPRQPLLDATIAQVGTKESYTVAPETQEVVKVLRLIANAMENGQMGLKHSSSGASIARECKFKEGGDLTEAEIDLHVYLVADPNFVIGGVRMARAQVVHDPELQGASETPALPTM